MFQLRPYQREAIDAVKLQWSSVNDTMITAATGAGKAQPNTEPVLTSTGWREMGKISIGENVIGSDGHPHDVLGVFPQGTQPVFLIAFSDGTWTRATGEHLWSVQTKSQKSRGSGFVARQTIDLMGDLADGSGSAKWFLPIVESVKFEYADLPVAPYLLGALLGDGCMRLQSSPENKKWMCGTVTISSPDGEVLERVADLLPDDVKLVHRSSYDYGLTSGISGRKQNSLLQSLRKLGVMGKLSYQKEIPDSYMLSSYPQRLELLRGMMDTDGAASKSGRAPVYSTSSPTMANQFAELVRSLGGVTEVRSRSTSYTYKGEALAGRTSYRITVSLSDCPFHLGRKIAGWNPDPRQGRTKSIVSIEPDGEEDSTCLLVDSPDHLYVTRGYNLTHNTQIFLGLLAEELNDHPGSRALIIAHRKELIEQPVERLAQFWPDLYDDAGIVMAKQNESSKRIVVATVQTLNGNGRLDDILSHGPIDYLVIDEAHHSPSDTYKSVVERLKIANPNLKHLGVTATPIRADEVGLAEVYKTEAAHYGIKEMVSMSYLAPPRWLAIQTGISLANVPKSGSGEDRDYTRAGLRDVFETSNCFDLVVESHKKYASGRLAICFTASVEGAYSLAETFNEAGIPAAAADGTTPKDERKAILDDFRTGDLEVICNVALWTEGLDLPEISCVHMVRPTQSDAYYMQAIGRGLRLFPGKEDALILDYCPAETRNIVMLGDVLGLEVRKEAYVNEDAEEGEVMGGFTFDGEVTWMEGDPMEIVSRQLDYLDQSPWKWQRPSKGAWMILGLGPGTDEIDRTLALSPASDKMELWAIWKCKDDRWHTAKRVQVGDFDTLSDIGEELASKNGVPALAKKKQRWRTQPPSPGQLKFAKNLGIDPTGKSKGDIADGITYKLAMNALRRNGATI